MTPLGWLGRKTSTQTQTPFVIFEKVQKWISNFWIGVVIQIMSLYNLKFDFKVNVGHSDIWSSDFALYLEEYFMYKRLCWGFTA